MMIVVAAKLGFFAVGTLAFILGDHMYEIGVGTENLSDITTPTEGLAWGLLMIIRGFLMFFWAFCIAKMLGIL